MRIGFVNIYSWRPHGGHLFYLVRLAEQAGHEARFLTCDSSVSTCYSRQIKGTGRIRECSTCIAGGVRSYATSGISSISQTTDALSADELDMITLASSCTLTRVEAEDEWDDAEVLKVRETLRQPVSAAYMSALRWIEREKLDAVVCFNGRIDMTRAITLACERAGIPYLTHERPWFGHGLQLTPNANCLSLFAFHEMAENFAERPLTKDQASMAAKMTADRFLRQSHLEWRSYNLQPKKASWPVASDGPRVLVIPSSKNEFAGHPEWRTGWTSNTEALDDFMEAKGIMPEQVVVRCHPNWAETIGKASGSRSLSHYTNWCRRRGIAFISSEEKDSTYDLVEQADIVVVNGGSTVVEAAARGKTIYCLGPSRYARSGFVNTISSPDEMSSHNQIISGDPIKIAQRAMRYVVVSAIRHPQFVPYVRAKDPTQNEFFDGGNSEQLISILKTGQLVPDDSTVASSEDEELEIVKRALAGEWKTLSAYDFSMNTGNPIQINRRHGLRWVDGFRPMLPRGDR